MFIATFSFLFTVALIALAFYFNYWLASKMADVARAKGYDPAAHHIVALCVWLSIFGYLYVIALPDLVLRAQNEQSLLAQQQMVQLLSENKRDY